MQAVVVKSFDVDAWVKERRQTSRVPRRTRRQLTLHDSEQPQNFLGSQLVLTNTSHLFFMHCPISNLNNL